MGTVKRRLLKLYERLYHQLDYLFERVDTTIFPNGEHEIWFQTDDGLGMRIKAQNGPHGLSISVQRFPGGHAITAVGNAYPDASIAPVIDYDEVHLVQYRLDPDSQAFRRWATEDGPYPEHMK